MLKYLILSLFATSAVGFGIKRQANPVKTSALFAFENELGAQPPLGFWDPLNLLDDDFEKFERYRYVELKHGRIAMLAFLGEIVTRAGIRLPGKIDYAGDTFADVPNGWAAVGAIPKEGFLQLFVFVGFLELFIFRDVTGTG